VSMCHAQPHDSTGPACQRSSRCLIFPQRGEIPVPTSTYATTPIEIQKLVLIEKL
jgi:hypothetical protein